MTTLICEQCGAAFDAVRASFCPACALARKRGKYASSEMLRRRQLRQLADTQAMYEVVRDDDELAGFPRGSLLNGTVVAELLLQMHMTPGSVLRIVGQRVDGGVLRMVRDDWAAGVQRLVACDECGD